MKATVYANNLAANKGRGITEQPYQYPNKFIRVAKSFERCIFDYGFTARSKTSIGISKEVAILMCYEESWCNCIDPDLCTKPVCRFNTHPSGVIIDGGFSHRIAKNPCDG